MLSRVFGLRAALTLLVLIAIAPVFAVVVLGSLSEQEGRLERAEASLKSVVELSAAHQERLVESARQMLTAIAYAPPIYGDDAQACAGYLRRLQGQYPVAYGTFGLLDTQGRLACRATPPAAAVQSNDRPFFRTAVRTGRFSVGEFTVSRASGRAVLPFGLPVYRDSGELRGVVYVAIDVDQADEQLRRMSIPQDMTLLVLDGQGVVLAGAGSATQAVGAALEDGFLKDAVARGEQGSARVAMPGGEWMYAVRPVGRAGEAKLFDAGLASTAEILAPASERLRHQLVALGVISLLAAAAAWAFGDRVVVRPLGRLMRRAGALAREELQLVVPPAPVGLRELAELDAGFHDMARRLAERSVQRDGAMAEMAHQKGLLESVLASMAEGVLVVGSGGRFLHMNEAAVRILPGLAQLNREHRPLAVPTAALGLYGLDGDTAVPLERGPAGAALRGQSVDHFRYLVRAPLSPHGEKVVQGGAWPVRTPDAARAGAVIVFFDVTDAWRAELAMKQLNETLEQRVSERTQELHVANRELESFSYSVSHDLRAPLQVIDGFGQALLSRHAGQLDDKGRHYLERIRENAAQMSDLIDDLLSLARVTRAEILTERFDLAVKARQIVERQRQRFPEREVEVQIDSRMVCVGDPRLLAVVLENLIENAWKFTARTPNARIGIGCRLSPGGDRVFFVRDNGAGFDMAFADKLFNAFQRLHSTAEFEGTGIGLATVHRIVSRHGGRVWAHASPGEGAVFEFSLKPGAGQDAPQEGPAG